MITMIKPVNDRLQEFTREKISPGTWIKMTEPSGDELCRIANLTAVDVKYLQQICALDACPRAMTGDNCLMLVLNVPVADYDKNLYDSVLLGIILTPDYLISSCNKENEVLTLAADGTEVYDPAKLNLFFLQILNQTDKVFVRYIEHIRQRTGEIEVKMRRSIEMREFFKMLDMEKGLTYFTAALRDNAIVLESLLRIRSLPRLQHFLQVRGEEEDLFETLIIENRRALRLAETYSEIMGGMMDAFSSVIEHNLNKVIKFLASMTVLIAIPTMLSSFWSMSLVVPWHGNEHGFWYVLLLALAAVSGGWFWLKKKNML